MVNFLILCTIGTGVLGLILRNVTSSVIAKFGITHGLTRKKKSVFKKVRDNVISFVALMLPVVQIFMIIMMLVLIVVYSQTKNTELVEKLKEEWKKGA